MALAVSATPLVSLDAVVVDTETTTLDPRNARVVEIAAIRLARGRVREEEAFTSLVNPGEPIPAVATGVHSIDDGKVATAPSFATMWPAFAEFAGNKIVIGHAIGFDLAVLQRECERAGIAWQPPRALDTRLLAQVAEPQLAGYSLDQLCAWLGVPVTGRHSAHGDALTTARLFQALVPKLREGGIRTLAEAMAACRALTDVLDQQHRAGWVEPAAARSIIDAERTLGRIETYPYRHRIRDVMTSPPKFLAAETALGDAVKQLIGERISSFYVARKGASEQRHRPGDTAIITERDVLRAIAAFGVDALSQPVAKFASEPLAVVPAEAFVYRAIGRMSRLNVRHLGVVDEAGYVVGALSARDLLRLRASEAISLGDEIDQAVDVHELGVAWAKLPHVAASLQDEGVPARDIAAVISREVGALTRQAAVLAERTMQVDGRGTPPCPYALTVLGSAGRGESLLAMDQDNAIVFARGEPGGAEDRWFEALGARIADILHDVGLPYCKGGVMAKNAAWRGALDTWRARIDEWIGRSRPEDLLSVDIFFDMRCVHGDAALADDIWRYGFSAARGQTGFAKLLAEAAGEVTPGLGLFGRFRTENGRVDLKRSGLFGVVSAARVLAVKYHVVERATPARLAALNALGIGGERDLEQLGAAQGVFLELILRQQIDDIAHGRPPTNAVMVKTLDRQDRERLHDALAAVRHLNEMVRDLLFRG
jgi:CBS domain-containing protein